MSNKEKTVFSNTNLEQGNLNNCSVKQPPEDIKTKKSFPDIKRVNGGTDLSQCAEIPCGRHDGGC